MLWFLERVSRIVGLTTTFPPVLFTGHPLTVMVFLAATVNNDIIFFGAAPDTARLSASILSQVLLLVDTGFVVLFIVFLGF